MQNSILFRRSSFFIDAINVFFYTDLFLYHELMERMKEDQLLVELFSENLPNFNVGSRGELDRLIIKSTVTKKHQNILYDWINDNRLDNSTEGLLASLYMDMLINPTCGEYMQVTELGNTIKLLANDRRVNKIHIYLPFDSPFIRSMIGGALNGGSNTNIIIGGKEDFLKNNIYDSYMFENVGDIDTCLIEGLKKYSNSQLIREVLVPTYEFNLEETRTNLDKLLEQITYHKLKLNLTPNEYVNNYKLSINTIAVPV